MKRLLFLFALPFFAACSTSHYCYFVRHAEKLDETPYSVLSAAGHQRAAVLRDSLIHKKVDLIFATPFIRTQETAGPLATAINKPISIYRHNAIDSIIAIVKSNSNKNILIVGHSGPMPAIIEGLTGQKIQPITEPEYDNLYIIKTKKGKSELILEKYGYPSKR